VEVAVAAVVDVFIAVVVVDGATFLSSSSLTATMSSSSSSSTAKFSLSSYCRHPYASPRVLKSVFRC
jgi:hypothetical protein